MYQLAKGTAQMAFGMGLVFGVGAVGCCGIKFAGPGGLAALLVVMVGIYLTAEALWNG